MEAAAVFAQILYALAAVFCLFYYLPCALYWGIYGKELAAVLLVGFGSAALFAATTLWGMTPILWLAFAIFLLGLSVFLYVEWKVLWGMFPQETQEVPSWLLVPGYKPRKGKIPGVLRERTDKAAQLLLRWPQTKAILSGGVTDGEISEAALMKQLLTERGIDPARLILEENSTTTEENMRFCRAMCGGEGIGMVTNGFHLYRACGEAQKAGFARVAAFPAGNGSAGLVPYHMTREFLTVVNDKVNGFL